MAASGYKDYFKVLGVERSASSEDIKSAFRKLARKHHPDVNQGDPSAEARFKEISEAYEVLSDTEKRSRYEQFGQYWNQRGGMGNRGSATSGFDVDFGRYGNFDEFINELLGRFAGPGRTSGFPSGFSGAAGFPRSAANQKLNLDAEVIVKINFAEALRGTERTLSVNEERVQVRVPEGIKPGSRLRLKGKGNLQPGTGRRGDLFLKIEVNPHPVWRLEGDQLRTELPVAFEELALGATVKVMTPDGEAEVVIPPGTAPGCSLRLKGKGWPSKNGRGDLLFTLMMNFPVKWSSEEIELLHQLQRVRGKDPRRSWFDSARL